MQERIALGFGNNVDYEIVWNTQVVEELIVHYGIRADELDVDRPIDSERNLVISILRFVKSGGGGERFVASSAIIEHFAQRFDKKITLGGTSMRAAIVMRKLGYTSVLHLVTINDHVRQLIPQDCLYICSNSKESLHPHLIVQFGQATHINAGDINFSSKRANRIIYHSDHDNIAMQLNVGFANLVANARVFLISGFNAMQSKELLANRLASLLRIMAKLPKDAVVYYEDGGFYEPSFRQLIYATLADKITVFSLNEDELQAHLGRPLDILNVFQIQDALADLQKLIPVPIIVVHSMYWALAYGENAQHVAAALKGGVTMATARFCYGDDFTIAQYEEIASLSPNHQGAKFADALQELLTNQICCIPVAEVEQSNATTVGLGDAFVGGFLPHAHQIQHSDDLHKKT